jgi:dihydropyrimidinase
VRPRELHMAIDWGPYEGREVTGWPVAVVRSGRVVMANGEIGGALTEQSQ